MQSRFVFKVAAGVILLVHAAQADDRLPIGTRIPVKIHVAATAAEQLERCEVILKRASALTDRMERLKVALEVMGNLQVVPQRWPTNKPAVLRAYNMQADVGLQYDMTRNALDALVSALPISAGTVEEPRIHVRIASVYEKLGRFSDARHHFDAARRSPQFRQLSAMNAALALQTEGLFLMRQNEPRQAMTVFRMAATTPGIPSSAKAAFLLSSLKEAVRLKDDNERAEARRDVRDIEIAIRAARGKATAPADLRRLEAIEHDLQQLRTRHRLP